MKDKCKVTLVQLTTMNQTPESIIERMPAFFEKAAAAGSDLVVFPEYVLGNKIGIDHPRVQKFFALAKEHNINAISGMVESWGNTWATTAIVVDRGGNLLGRYNKCHAAAGPGPHYWPPLPGSDEEAYGTMGSQFKTFTLDFGTIGILQCYDGFFPEAFGVTSYLGAEIILWINGRNGQLEDAFAQTAAHCYGCVVGANITDGANTGFAGPEWYKCISGEGEPEFPRLWPRIPEPGDNCVTAEIDLKELRWRRKHLRTMHQRRPELYGLLTQDVKTWHNYPDVPWDYPECADLANKGELDPKDRKS